jgi:hypothetical protein
MVLDLDKIMCYAPLVLIALLLLMVLFVELFGCEWNDIFNNPNMHSFFTPGIKVIG